MEIIEFLKQMGMFITLLMSYGVVETVRTGLYFASQQEA